MFNERLGSYYVWRMSRRVLHVLGPVIAAVERATREIVHPRRGLHQPRVRDGLHLQADDHRQRDAQAECDSAAEEWI